MKKNRNIHLNKNGFTLIELLVVIVVISALTGIMISVINPSKLRARTRDGQRVADLKQIQTALELYYGDNRAYPESAGNWFVIINADTISGMLTGGGYINQVPRDPLFDTSYSYANLDACYVYTGDKNHRYNYRSNGTYYILTAIMEDAASNDGHECASLDDWGTYGCSLLTQADICYGVENP